jgi:Mycoplasma protein of unknown function, DUF285
MFRAATTIHIIISHHRSPSRRQTTQERGIDINGNKSCCQVLSASDIVNREALMALGASKPCSQFLNSPKRMEKEVEELSLASEQCDMTGADQADDQPKTLLCGSASVQSLTVDANSADQNNISQCATSQQHSAESSCTFVAGVLEEHAEVDLCRAKVMNTEYADTQTPQIEKISERKGPDQDVTPVSGIAKANCPSSPSEPGAFNVSANSSPAQQTMEKSSDTTCATSEMTVNPTSLKVRMENMSAFRNDVHTSSAPLKRQHTSQNARMKTRNSLGESEITGLTPSPRRSVLTNNDVSESEGSRAEDLSESLAENPSTPRKTMRSNTRQTVMHRRAMQKDRRSTAATEPGVIASNVSGLKYDSIIDDTICHGDDSVFSPFQNPSIDSVDAPRNEITFEIMGCTSKFAETEQDYVDLEFSSTWPSALTATLVAGASLQDDERAIVVEETTQALTSNAVVAEVIDLDSLISQKAAEVDNLKKRQQRLRSLAFLVFVVASAAVIISVTLTTVTSRPIPTPTPTFSPAPSLFASGNSAFRTREELVRAIEEYMEALYKGSAEDSAVAQRYGYPIGAWDVSGVKDFTKVFDFSRHNDVTVAEPFDFNAQNPVFRSFYEDLAGWDGKTFFDYDCIIFSAVPTPVSNANTMSEMFFGNTMFQGRGLSQWKVDNVADFSLMFCYNTNFNEDLGSWNTVSAKSMKGMFFAAGFHDGIASWDMSNVRRLNIGSPLT